MGKNLELKKQVVADIKDKLERAQGVVLVDYRGLTVAEVTELRNQFRAANVEYRVLKNNLISLAAKEIGIEGLDAYLEGPTAVAFGYEDPVAAAKVMNAFIKKAQKTEIKAGLLGKEVLDAKGVKALSDLPSREVLIAKMLGSLQSPIAGLLGVLNGVPRAFVCALDAVRKQKEETA